MITVFSEDHHLQNGKFELIDGQLVPPFENPKHLDNVMARVKDVGLGDVVTPQEFGTEPLERVHDPRFVEFLRVAHDEWREVHGDSDALPLCWPCRSLRQKVPDSIDGRLSYYSFDAGTPTTAGTWRAIISSANVALTGAKRVQGGEPVVFSLCRPPGHHATSDMYGGYCFLNNAAIAAQSFRDEGAQRVAILDLDYHHGNGTQAIFYSRADVLFVSLHADPRQEFPYFLGYKDETGQGDGEGFNINYPMPWGTAWGKYSQSLDDALKRIDAFAPKAIVISLGVDTFEKDPISDFKLRSDEYLEMGARIAGLELPTLFVMEGGYAIDEIGINTVNVLTGFESARGG